MGLKAKDKYAIPTCSDCHRDIHTKGQKTTFAKYGLDVDMAIKMTELYLKRFEESDGL